MSLGRATGRRVKVSTSLKVPCWGYLFVQLLIGNVRVADADEAQRGSTQIVVLKSFNCSTINYRI